MLECNKISSAGGLSDWLTKAAARMQQAVPEVVPFYMGTPFIFLKKYNYEFNDNYRQTKRKVGTTQLPT